MTWGMWIESAFTHFSVAFTLVYLVHRYRIMPTSVIRFITGVCIFAVEAYQIHMWQMNRVDTFLDIVYGFAGLWVALHISRE